MGPLLQLVVEARVYATPHALSAPNYSSYPYLATATVTGSITDSTTQDITEKAHQPMK